MSERYRGDPYDRGAADAYYSRRPDPHKWPKGWTSVECPPRIPLTDPEEIREYWAGYDEEEDRKDYQ